MVNAMQHGRTAASSNGNGTEIANLEHNGGDDMRQRKKAVKEQQRLANDDSEDELDFDVDIAGHHAMPPRTLPPVPVQRSPMISTEADVRRCCGCSQIQSQWASRRSW